MCRCATHAGVSRQGKQKSVSSALSSSIESMLLSLDGWKLTALLIVLNIVVRPGHLPRCKDVSSCVWQKRHRLDWSTNMLFVAMRLCVMCLKSTCKYEYEYVHVLG
jgi:hypothetical protein